MTPFSDRVLATGLERPWEATRGSDDHFGVIERAGKRVTRVDPEAGEIFGSIHLTVGATRGIVAPG